MSFKKYSPILLVIIGTIILFAIHKFAVGYLDLTAEFSNFNFSLEHLYLCFGIASLAIVSVLLVIKKRNFDQIGMSFMALITVKLIVFFTVFKPIISKDNTESGIERTNFIILFMVFLLWETFVSAQILKSKDN
jgi:hypothetical protein